MCVANDDGGGEQLRPVRSEVAGAGVGCHILCAVDAMPGPLFTLMLRLADSHEQCTVHSTYTALGVMACE